jgi:ribonuclease Z
VSNRELVVLGTASQTPTRERNQNGYLLRWDGEGLLFDPGEGTQRQMLLAGVKASEVTRICISHFHGDHCLGVPGVLQRLSLDQVTHVVHAYYPAASGDTFRQLRTAALFHDVVRLREQPVAGAQTLLPGPPFLLAAQPLSHAVPAIGYRLAEPDGRRMLPGKLAACGITGPDVGLLIEQGHLIAGGRQVSLAEVSEPRPGQRFAFIMDTRLCDAVFALADRADMLVCESTFLERDAPLAERYGHLTARQAGRVAAEAGARLLVLTHFSQRYAHEDGEQAAREAGAVYNGEIIAARDLTVIPVPGRQPPPGRPC